MRRSPLPYIVASVIGVTVTVTAYAVPAYAQLHWDVGAEAAVEKRFLRDTPAEGTGDASFGPLVRVTTHVAFFPLARLGLYGSLGFSPVSGGSLRTQVGGGMDIRLTPPLSLGLRNFKPFLFLGAGYIRTVTPGYTVRLPAGEARTSLASGGCLDIPIGLGATYRVRKPFEVGAVLGTRFAALCGGDTYATAPKYTVFADAAQTGKATLGKDSFALSVGLLANFEF
jgi:hypothetical protein